MDEWRSINWLRCSEDQLNKIRDDFKDLKFLAKEINNFEKGKSGNRITCGAVKL